jgi:SAM-dependent methyltransferase
VIECDLRGTFPFPDDYFDGVYHSHVLEHFTLSDGRRFIGECRRVLKPGGVLRVAVPDLAGICRLYLETLAKLEAGDRQWRGRHHWMQLELYDQMVRTVAGGEMAGYLHRPDLADKDFIIARIGNIAREIFESEADGTSRPSSTLVWRRWVWRVKSAPKRIRERLIALLLSRRELEALELGLFRLSGEVHQWMYDEYSLGSLLENEGFIDLRRCAATESRIENWATYGLDVGPDGFEHAPSSLYMEGRKP